MKKVVLFDLDNTLVECAKYYEDIEDNFVGRARLNHPQLTETFIRELVRSIDRHSCSLYQGFSRSRFPRSFEASSLALDAIAGRHPDLQRAAQERVLAEQVFNAPYTPYEGSLETLQELVRRGYELGIVTKGDWEIQWSKVKKNGIDKIVKSDNIFPVDSKNVAVYANIYDLLEADPTQSWFFGDSLKDDIGPNNALGVTTVHVQANYAPWHWEDAPATPTHVIHHLKEALELLPL